MSTSFFGPPSSRSANDRPKIRGPPTNGLFGSPYPKTKPSKHGFIAKNVSSNTARYGQSDSNSPNKPSGQIAGFTTPLFAGTTLAEVPKQTPDNMCKPKPKTPLFPAKGEVMKLSGQNSCSFSNGWKHQSAHLPMEQEGGKLAMSQVQQNEKLVCRENSSNHFGKDVPASSSINFYQDQAMKEVAIIKAAHQQQIHDCEILKRQIMQEFEIAHRDRLMAHAHREEANAYIAEAWKIKCFLSEKEKRRDTIIKDKIAERESQLELMMSEKITSLEEQIAIQQKKIAMQEMEWHNNVESKVAKLLEECKEKLKAENMVQLSSAVAACKQQMALKVGESSNLSHQDRYKEKSIRIINRDAHKLMNKVAGQLVELETRMEEMESSIKQTHGSACRPCQMENEEENTRDMADSSSEGEHTRDMEDSSSGLASADNREEISSRTATVRKVFSDSELGSVAPNALSNLPPLSASADNQTKSLNQNNQLPESEVDFPVIRGNYNHVTHSLLLRGSKAPIKCQVPTMCVPAIPKGPLEIPNRTWIKGCHKMKNKGSVTDRVRTDVTANAILARNNVVSSKRPGLGELDEKTEYAEAVDKAEMRTLSSQLRKIKFGKKHGRRVTFKDEPEVCIIPNRVELKEMEEASLRQEAEKDNTTVNQLEEEEEEDEDL